MAPTSPSRKREPDRVGLDEAPGAILELVRALGASPALVGITGPVGSGKSTLAEQFGGVVVRTDDYLPDYDALPEHERDLPERADLALLAEHLRTLGQGRPIEAPIWSFQEHRRVGRRVVEGGPLIVCEGIHALHATLAGVHHVRVFVEAGSEVRWRRWERIELERERGWGVEAARRYFDEVAEPTFAARAEAYRAIADLIVDNDR
ncbi:MAG: hypothetical protein R3B57_07175 [Phycisphaerales bacterium]